MEGERLELCTIPLKLLLVARVDFGAQVMGLASLFLVTGGVGELRGHIE